MPEFCPGEYDYDVFPEYFDGHILKPEYRQPPPDQAYWDALEKEAERDNEYLAMSDDADQIKWLSERNTELEQIVKLMQEECMRRGQRIADLEKLILGAAEAAENNEDT